MSVTELKFGGFGGQGIILSATIVGRAAAIFDDKYATLTQSFGPEARGSACSASVIVSDEPVTYPYVTRPNILTVMSQEAWNKFSLDLADDATVIYEKELVSLNGATYASHGIDATRIAEKLGRKVVQNIVMIGFFAAKTDVVTAQAMRRSVESSVPPGTEALNLKAFDAGFESGR